MMQDVVEADVAVVGGGLAGLFVAMGAAEQGARVVVMEKAKIERSGAIAGGVDHCLAYLNERGLFPSPAPSIRGADLPQGRLSAPYFH